LPETGSHKQEPQDTNQDANHECTQLSLTPTESRILFIRISYSIYSASAFHSRQRKRRKKTKNKNKKTKTNKQQKTKNKD